MVRGGGGRGWGGSLTLRLCPWTSASVTPLDWPPGLYFSTVLRFLLFLAVVPAQQRPRPSASTSTVHRPINKTHLKRWTQAEVHDAKFIAAHV